MTRAAEKLASRADDLPAGSMRRRILESARRFKSVWVELGRLLSQVKRESLWREWGYPSFERYCTRELFIRSATADKLTASYGFLERHEPQLAAKDDDTEAPPFEVIEVLSRAEAAGRFDASGWRELRDEVLERPPTPAAVSRKIAERYGAPAPTSAPSKVERIERVAALARRLADACREEPAVPRPVAERAGALAGEIEALLRR